MSKPTITVGLPTIARLFAGQTVDFPDATLAPDAHIVNAAMRAQDKHRERADLLANEILGIRTLAIGVALDDEEDPERTRMLKDKLAEKIDAAAKIVLNEV